MTFSKLLDDYDSTMADRTAHHLSIHDDEVMVTINGCTLPLSKARFAAPEVLARLEKRMRDAADKGLKAVLLTGSISAPKPRRLNFF